MKKLIAILVIILACSGCTATKYKVRRHNNRLIQEVQQNQNKLSAGHDWTRPYRNWDRRPTSKWPFQFLQ